MSYRTMKTEYRMTEFRSPTRELSDSLDEVKDFIASQEVISGLPVESWIMHSYDEDGHVIMLFWSSES